ncbi:MAG: hypothetical protein V7K88_07080 [Nostoc sp.]|uniref:hypothetical protein n=1 Tax=Nostoc sp. TaxID=1180 RepID=UPI002FFA7A9A
MTSVEGTYRNGRVELTEQPTDVHEGTQVIVTFIRSDEIDLASQGINEAQAEILRSHLATFADAWDSPEMSIYDNYDVAKTRIGISTMQFS